MSALPKNSQIFDEKVRFYFNTVLSVETVRYIFSVRINAIEDRIGVGLL